MLNHVIVGPISAHGSVIYFAICRRWFLMRVAWFSFIRVDCWAVVKIHLLYREPLFTFHNCFVFNPCGLLICLVFVNLQRTHAGNHLKTIKHHKWLFFKSVFHNWSDWQKKQKTCVYTPLMPSDVTLNAELALLHLWASSISHLTLGQKKTNCVSHRKNLKFCLQRWRRAWISTSEAAVGNRPFCFSWHVRQWSLHCRGHRRWWSIWAFGIFCSSHILALEDKLFWSNTNFLTYLMNKKLINW